MTTSADVSVAADAPAQNPHANQFALLGQRRFAPFFWTQFLGAGNDNLFKFAFTVMVTYQLQLEWLPPPLAGLPHPPPVLPPVPSCRSCCSRQPPGRRPTSTTRHA